MFFSINTGYQFSCVFLGFFSNGEEEQIFFRQFLMVNQKYINFLPLHIPSSLYTPIRIHSPLLYPPLNIYPFEHCFPLIWILRPKNLCFCCICTNCLMFTQPPPTKHLVSCFTYPLSPPPFSFSPHLTYITGLPTKDETSETIYLFQIPCNCNLPNLAQGLSLYLWITLYIQWLPENNSMRKRNYSVFNSLTRHLIKSLIYWNVKFIDSKPSFYYRVKAI